MTADAGAPALKAGNVAILRGGSESANSSAAIHAAMVEGLRAAGLPEAAISLVPTTDRAAVGLILSGLDGTMDLIIPRGGKGLTGRVMAEARVPVLAHLEGVCHVYVHEKAELAKSRAIAVNKMRRTGGAARETPLTTAVSQPRMACPYSKTRRADVKSEATRRCALFPTAKAASELDWSTGISIHHRGENRRRRRRCQPPSVTRLAPHQSIVTEKAPPSDPRGTNPPL